MKSPSVRARCRRGVSSRRSLCRLAGTMLRAPMSLQKMPYDAASGKVICRSKMHAGLKRNFQVMPGAEWLALLCQHIPANARRGDGHR